MPVISVSILAASLEGTRDRRWLLAGGLMHWDILERLTAGKRVGALVLIRFDAIGAI